MKASKGYYCVIQYCPDLGRFEAANVGVLLFCPERAFLKALTSRNNSRIIHFFGSQGHDWDRINSFKHGLEERLQKEGEAGTINTDEDLRHFIAMRANVLQITRPNPIKVFDPEKDLHNLYQEIIGERARSKPAKSLRGYVADMLSQPDLRDKVVPNVKVNVPVLNKEVEIPFGYQNGRFHLITPVRFAAKHPEQSVTTACKYAVEGRSLYNHSDPQRGDLQLVIVGQFLAKDHDTPSRVRRVFQEHNVELYALKEMPDLIDVIRQTGKNIDKTKQ